MNAEPLPQSFINKKARILEQLAIPASSYDDLSPKGSIDEGIRDLIDEINGLQGYVTTSSCAGRICVFLEGKKVQEDSNVNGEEGVEDIEKADVNTVATTTAGIGGKGGGGKWLFVSHDEISVDEVLKVGEGESRKKDLLGMEVYEGNEEVVRECLGRGDCRLIHLKFEPMVSFLSLSLSLHLFSFTILPFLCLLSCFEKNIVLIKTLSLCLRSSHIPFPSQ
jgi:tRNA wybutosine-synthesizing protein 3